MTLLENFSLVVLLTTWSIVGAVAYTRSRNPVKSKRKDALFVLVAGPSVWLGTALFYLIAGIDYTAEKTILFFEVRRRG